MSPEIWGLFFIFKMKGLIYWENRKLYKKIKIGRTLYKVFICYSLKFNGVKHFGFIDYPRKEIFLLKDKHYKNTLNHELTHALIYEIYLNSKKNKKILKKLRSNEPFIESLTLLIEQNFKQKF
jgi:hypothetical protein